MIEPPPKGATSQHHQNRTHFSLNSGEDTSQGTPTATRQRLVVRQGSGQGFCGLDSTVDKNIAVTLRTLGFHLDTWDRAQGFPALGFRGVLAAISICHPRTFPIC